MGRQKQLVVLSGKGGTGKTTLTSSFIELGGFEAFADCDVDAPNLELILHMDTPAVCDDYFGMDKAKINPDLCIGCGTCADLCRFSAITSDDAYGSYKINPFACEGCGLCVRACPVQAASMVSNKAGYTYTYDSHPFLASARLKMGEGNSGLLVTQVKKNLKKSDAAISIVDGSPGIGCPVLASITGADMVIAVTEPSQSGLEDLKRLVLMLVTFDLKPYVVINKFNLSQSMTLKIQAYLETEGLSLLGMIPFERQCLDNLAEKKTLVQSDTAAADSMRKIHAKALNILS